MIKNKDKSNIITIHDDFILIWTFVLLEDIMLKLKLAKDQIRSIILKRKFKTHVLNLHNYRINKELGSCLWQLWQYFEEKKIIYQSNFSTFFVFLCGNRIPSNSSVTIPCQETGQFSKHAFSHFFYDIL